MEEFTIKKKEELDPQEKSFRRRKDIIKNVIIVFLVVMLGLTFFSNTIQNYSLPKVAVQYIEPGTITTVIRGEGVVESGDPYNVMVKYSKTVGSINAKVGTEVKEGDLLLTLQSEDSEELTAAKKALEDAKKAYNDALLDPEVDAAAITSSQGTLDINGFRNKISALQTAITLAEKTVAEKQKNVDNLNNQISITSGNTVSEAEKT
ncbi:MAG: efflux RND transporter periplasmic adaptor subunit, partial [Lachnospiraceae bacterium]|nr:efflux RND transporter periplasmic adaptor subunit [Lachnospiraceae bacterium]